MITSEAMTPSSDGNDNAQALSLDDAASLDWNDPYEETGPVEDEQKSDKETVEPDEDAEGPDETDEDFEDASEDPDGESDDDAEDEGEGEQSSTPEPEDTATVTIDGAKLSIAELKKGYFREADYTRQKQRVSEKERNLEAISANVTSAVHAIAEHLQKSLPPAHDQNLAITNPAEYVRKKAIHDTAMAGIAEVIKLAHAPQDAAKTLTEQQQTELLEAETAKLAEAFPQVRTPQGHKQFFDTAAMTARELGYSDEEIASATDHRLFKLAHYARIGMRAEAAKAKANKKVENVPPVAPTKRRQQNGNRSKNREAMSRLSKTGSIHDAMAIDFD